MVEGQRGVLFGTGGVQELLDRSPAGVARVAAGARGGQVGRQREMGDADHSHPGVPPRVAVGGELLEVGAVVLRGLRGNGRVMGPQPGFLEQFACRGLGQVLVLAHEAAGKGPAPLERGLATADRQRAQRVTAHGQHHQVDGDGEGRES